MRRWTGSSLCMPLAADLLRAWPGGGGEGVAYETGSLLFSSSLGVAHCFGLAPEPMAKVHMDKEFALLRLSPPISAAGPDQNTATKDLATRRLQQIPARIGTKAERKTKPQKTAGVEKTDLPSPSPCQARRRGRRARSHRVNPSPFCQQRMFPTLRRSSQSPPQRSM